MGRRALPSSLRDRRWTLAHLAAFGILVGFAVLATFYSVTTPAWEAPDEEGHFIFAAHLVRTGTLPMQRVGELSEAHQPPLYYLAAAMAMLPANLDDPTGAPRHNPRFMWPGQIGVNASFHTSAETFPFRGQALALHLARGLSVLMGLVTVALVIAMGWTVFPERRLVGLLAGALVAFNPQFLFISGAANNDNLLTLLATGAGWQVLRILKRADEWRQWLILGIVIAAAILAKLSGAVVGLVAGTVLVTLAIRRRSPGLFVRGALAMSLPVVLLTSWWFVRNQVLYGDPLGWSMYHQLFAVNLRQGPLQWSDFPDLFSVQFRSFWGFFGWKNVPAPSWFYQAIGLLLVLSIVGIGASALRRRLSALTDYQKAALGVFVVALLAQEAFVVGMILRCNDSCYQGRYLFPVIGPAMILASLGLVGLWPWRAAPFLAGGLGLLVAGAAVYMPINVVEPAYRIVPLPKWSLWLVPNRTAYTFDDTFDLKGYRLDPAADGSRVSLTLYWQAARRPDFDYSVFAHLIDEAGQLVAQQDQGPGANLGHPPTAWWPGDVVADEHVIAVPPGLAPGIYRFRVGVYNWSTGEQLSVWSKGEEVGRFVILDRTLRR